MGSSYGASGSERPGGGRRAAGGGAAGSADLAALLALVARGDHAVFEAVYEAVAPAVFGLVQRVVRDAAQSEEVTQEVLVEVWRAAARMVPRPSHGMTAPVVVSGLQRGDKIWLTVEPAAGSRHPTTRPVRTIAMPS